MATDNDLATLDRLEQSGRDPREDWLKRHMNGHKLPEAEWRSVSMGTDGAGGYAALQRDVMDEWVRRVKYESPIVGLVYSFESEIGKGINAPKISVDGDDAAWTTELDPVTADSSLAFGNNDLVFAQLLKYLKVSRMWFNRVPNSVELVLNLFAGIYARTWEKALLTGSGSGQPRGIFTAHADGIPTSRDVSTGNTTTEISYEGLWAARQSIEARYLLRPNTRWLCHPDFVTKAALLTDPAGRPIVDTVNGKDRVLGVQVAYSAFAPNTWTTGQYVAAIGDLSQVVMTYSQFGLLTADQLLAVTGELAMFGIQYGAANVQTPTAWARVKLG